jgi:hypothetical protein
LLPEGEIVLERERHMIQWEKFMLLIVWIPRGFPMINVHDEGPQFNALDDMTGILSSLSEWCASDAPEGDRKVVVPADNARQHSARLSVEFFEDNRMKKAPHPPHSPDITPYDFVLGVCQQDIWPVAHLWMQGNFLNQL